MEVFYVYKESAMTNEDVITKAKQDQMNTAAFGEHGKGDHLLKTTDIPPSPTEFSTEEIQNDEILRFFHYAHLPASLQARSKPFCDLVRLVIDTTPRNPERTVALRKLLEAKDAAIRAALP